MELEILELTYKTPQKSIKTPLYGMDPYSFNPAKGPLTQYGKRGIMITTASGHNFRMYDDRSEGVTYR